MTMLRNPIVLAVLALVLLALLASSVVIVDEKKQAVILRLEKPLGTINAYHQGEEFGKTGAGLFLKIPFIDQVVWVDKRIQGIALEDQQVLSTDQTPLQVDAYARFRIVDPLKMVITARTEAQLAQQLTPILGSALRNELGKRPFAALLSPERGEVMDNIQNALQVQASQYGVQIVDVRIKHADLPNGAPLTSALDRMGTARRLEATTITAQGRKKAQIIMADADAEAARIYADSFNKDPNFYNFYRAMQSYQYTFGASGQPVEGDTQIILSPNNGYLKEFTGQQH